MMHNQGNCSFCGVADAILRNGLAFALYDTSPVSPGHALIIPVRHVADYFDTSAEEREAMMALAMEIRKLLERSRHPDGYNLGINVGESAGQTVFHVHLHLIPRYRGDVENPRGGVRGVIPARQNY
jgi:diadenosine tetraphosphate (Ap4A) HIT family hydrolase